MAINYPTSLDAWTNPTGADTLATTPHSTHHGNHYDAIEALEAKVGINSSAVTTSLDYKVTQLEAAGLWLPGDHGFKAWNYDPALTTTFANPTAGTLYVYKVRLPATTITNIVFYAASGTTPTTAYAALYVGTAAGALLSQSANQAGLYGAAGTKVFPLGAPQVVTAGVYYAAFWCTGSGPGHTSVTAAGGHPNAGLGSTVPRFGTANTGLTTTAPANIGTITALTANAIWAAAS